jgi:hypothetical protein
LDLAGAGHQFTASAFFVAGEMTEADFLDYLTKGVIIFGDRIGFDAGTKGAIIWGFQNRIRCRESKLRVSNKYELRTEEHASEATATEPHTLSA